MGEPIVKLMLATVLMLMGFTFLPARPAESSTCCTNCQNRLNSCYATCDNSYTSCARAARAAPSEPTEPRSSWSAQCRDNNQGGPARRSPFLLCGGWPRRARSRSGSGRS